MRARWLFASLMAIGFFLVFIQAGAPSLDSDGIHYASVAKEIARSGRWLLPYDPVTGANYYFHLHGSVWPTALLFKLLGVSSATAKLYSMGMTLLALAGIFLLGRRLIGSWGGWCAGIAFLATDHVLRIARQCRVDLPLVGYIVWAYMGVIRAQTGSRAWYLLAGAASLGAVMTKEIVGLVPLCSAFVYLILRRKWRDLIHPAFLAAFGIALIPPALITVIERKLYHATLWQQYLQQNFFFLAQAKHLAQPWTYYLWAIGDKYGYLLPLALPGAWFAWREIRTGKEPRWILIFLWVVAFPLGFSLATHKVHYYILPTYAGTALLAGLACERWIAQRWRPRIARAAVALAGIAAVALACFPVPVHKVRYRKNIELVPRLNALLAEAPGELLVIHQDVASLVFYSNADSITGASNDGRIDHQLHLSVPHRRYCLIGHKHWALLDPAVRPHWGMLLDDGERYLLVEQPQVGRDSGV